MSKLPPDRCCRSMLKRLWLSSFLHRSGQLAWRSIKLAALLLFLVWFVGMPGRWIEDRLQPYAAPYALSIHRITWSPLHGVIIRNIELTAPDIAAIPVIQMDAAVLKPDYRKWLRGDWDIVSIGLENGSVFFPMRDYDRQTTDLIYVLSIYGSVETATPEMHVNLTAISDLGTRIHINGEILGSARKPERETTAIQNLYALQLGMLNTPDWLKRLRNRMQNLDIPDAPKADITFRLDPDTPENNRVDGTFHAGRFQYAGRQLDGIRIEANYADQVVHISKCQIEDQNNRRFALTGQYHRGNDLFSAHAYSDLSSDLLLLLAPFSWQHQLDKLGIRLHGPMRSEAWIGPCSLAQVPAHWGGWLSAEAAELHSLPIEKAFCAFKREGAILQVNDGLLRGGTGPGAGEMTFSMTTDYASRTAQGQYNIGLDIGTVRNVLPPGLRRVIEMFSITDKPLNFTGEFSAPLDQIDELIVNGILRGTNIVFRGVALTGADVGLSYADNRVVLDPFRVYRPIGEIVGKLDLDFSRKLYGIDLDITTNPGEAAPMAGPKVAHHFRHYAFTDDIFVRVRGRVDTDRDEETDLHVQLSGRNIDIKQFKFERISLQAHRKPGVLSVSNIVGYSCQGIATGSLEVVYQEGADTFLASLDAREVSIDRLAAMLGHSTTNSYEGVLAFTTELAGLFPDIPGWSNLSGRASVRVDDGRLMLIPVFGGLSTLLSAMAPGLGFSEQNLLTATLDFRDGAIYSDNVKLQGNMVSIAASGYYHWTDGLNVYVQAHPFRDGSIASAVRVVTIPISYLLEFKVTGPLRNPRWRPANLPF